MLFQFFIIVLLVKQKGYVNEVQLQLELPARPEEKILTIILRKEADPEEMARRFYRLNSLDAIEETYKKRLKELEDTQQATASALTKLQEERDQAKAAAEKASEELARIQLGQTSKLNQETKRLFVDGKVEEAIKLLDDKKLRQSVTQAQKKRAEADKEIEDAVQGWLLSSTFYYPVSVWGRRVVASDSPRACPEKPRDLSACRGNYAQQPGILDGDQGRIEEALDIYESFANNNPERFSADVTRVKNLLADLPNTQGP